MYPKWGVTTILKSAVSSRSQFWKQIREIQIRDIRCAGFCEHPLPDTCHGSWGLKLDAPD